MISRTSGGGGISSNVLRSYKQWMAQYGKQYGTPPQLLWNQMMEESGGNPNARNKSGASGLMQFMPGTAAQFNINPMNAQQSIKAASEYDAQLKKQTGSWSKALYAYSGHNRQYASQVLGGKGYISQAQGVKAVSGAYSGSGSRSGSSAYEMSPSSGGWASFLKSLYHAENFSLSANPLQDMQSLIFWVLIKVGFVVIALGIILIGVKQLVGNVTI